MRVAAVPALYLVLMALYFYRWKEDVAVSEPWGWVSLAGLAILQIAAGIAIARWWSLALPFAAIVVAIPFGYGEGVGQEAPIWLYYGYVLAVPAAALVALGVGGRKLAVRQR
jgi:hypothetical protein